MKKLIVLTLVFALSFSLSGVAVAITGYNGSNINTGLERSTGGGQQPIIKAKWEMNGPSWDGAPGPTGTFIGDGTDDDEDPGAQFMPKGIWGDRQTSPDDGEKEFTICAIVTDPDGVSDIDGVYTDWYYPSDRAFHPEDPSDPDETFGGPAPSDTNPDGDTSPDYDYGLSGCGVQVEDENELHQLSKADGIELFCNQIRSDNNDLPTFFYPYDYDEICGETGELEKETAYVYCADKKLEWEDPAGDYKVEVLALDKAGLFSYEGYAIDYNYFEYLAMTGFEVDFSSIAYGEVKLNTHKRVSGDKTFSLGDTLPSVRNIGNTRLYMWVEQDDMEFGTTDGAWNVQYDARVGNSDADWKYYYPEELQPLEDILDLSETEEMDFSIEVYKFPFQRDDYVGTMDLSATPAEFRQCNGG